MARILIMLDRHGDDLIPLAAQAGLHRLKRRFVDEDDARRWWDETIMTRVNSILHGGKALFNTTGRAIMFKAAPRFQDVENTQMVVATPCTVSLKKCEDDLPIDQPEPGVGRGSPCRRS